MKKILRTLLALLAALLLVLLGYVAYVLLSYHRIPDQQVLPVQSPETCIAADCSLPSSRLVEADVPYTAISYNIGFGAYAQDFSFFMDGGVSSWAKSQDSVLHLTTGAGRLTADMDADFVMFEETDFNSTRSHHVNQKSILDAIHQEDYSVAAVNYDSPFLFYPFTQPHGKSYSGLVLYSRFPVTSALRRSLPITTNPTKLIDLDRCYMVSRLPMADGRTLVLYTIHATAYTKDAAIKASQLNMLVEDMMAEYQQGNVVICGGDFNMEMCSTQVVEHPVDWAHPLDRAVLSQLKNAWDILSEEEKAQQPGSCRDTSDVYDPETTETWIVDGFLVSPNVTVERIEVVDNHFLYSDHNPVKMTFRIQPVGE